jgi:hypothetical protein
MTFINPTRVKLEQPIPRVARGAASLNAHTPAASTWTAIPVTETSDTDGFHGDINNTRFTVPAGLAGQYLVTVVLVWGASSSAGEWRVAIAKNGGRVREVPDGNIVNFPLSQTVTDLLLLEAGDFVEAHVWQNAAATRVVQTLDITITYLGSPT